MRAKKHLGQNFLRDGTVVRRIVDALSLVSSETVIEIGPGRGALTEELLEDAGHVIAVEFDRDMVGILRTAFALRSNLSIVNEDALNVGFATLIPIERAHRSVKLVANLPYNISTPILQRLMEQRHLFSRIVLMFQREVVDRITAGPGGKERGYLSVLVENVFEIEKLFDVSPHAFTPVPKVWSSVVRLRPQPPVIENESLLRSVAGFGFAMRRKTLANNLASRFNNSAKLLMAADIDGQRRAETLSIAEWARLVAAVEATKAGDLE